MKNYRDIERFRAILEKAQKSGLVKEGYTPSFHDYSCTIKMGRKYANVDCGGSGKYMVVLETGEIFGIKGYGVINRKRAYGTLDTIDEWNWTDYTGFKK